MSEQIYDDEVAPLLLQAAAICKRHGMSMVASVEFAPGETGETYVSVEGSGVKFNMAYCATTARGNLDNFWINFIKWCNQTGIDTSQSMIVHQVELAGKLSAGKSG